MTEKKSRKTKILFESKSESFPNVVFPHEIHSYWLQCNICHETKGEQSSKKSGANKITMQKNIEEQYCGSAGCHNSAYAFPLYFCDGCHTTASNK
ncbi:MAG: hypothetical protein KAT90_07695 [Gammaproteobacteria bacterium]|nr:hypothetical protein [Gammaproteobacteria bacterium]